MALETDLADAWTAIESTLGETVYLLPWGDSGVAFSATAVVNRRSEEGSNEVRGDGRNLDRRDGKEIRRSATITLAKTHNVEEDVRDPWAVVIFDSAADATSFAAGDTTLGYRYRIKRRISSTLKSEKFLMIRVMPGAIRRSARPKG